MIIRSQTAAAGFTVSADLLHGLIDCAEQCGLPRDRFGDVLRDKSGRAPPARYSGDRVIRVWDRVLRLSGDPIIGFRMALVAGMKTFGVLGLIAPRCATVLDAFRQTERYSALASQAAHIAVARDAKSLSASITLDVPASEVRNAILLWGLTNLSLMPGRLTGESVRPISIACAFAPPDPPAARALKQLGPFVFDARQNQVRFERSIGELQIPSADADLKLLLTEVMERHLADLGPAGSLEQALLVILRQMLDGTMPTLASLSAGVGMSQRTLQRRLGDAGTTFHALLQQVLKERAEELLSRGDMSQGEIAFLLGYSEVSAFSRAYRGWTGRPPGAVYA
jgi:AraC-like DNA-binding protein